MRKVLIRLFSLTIMILSLSACQLVTTNNPKQEQQVLKPIMPTPPAGQATITGKVLDKQGQPITDTPVRLAQVFRKGEDGAFMLDLAHSPSSISDPNGFFVLVSIPPAEYLLVVGKPEDNNYIIYQDSAGKPYTFEIKEDTTQDLGDVTVDYVP